METSVEIPQALIYKVIDGKPIYDKNYKKVLNKALAYLWVGKYYFPF